MPYRLELKTMNLKSLLTLKIELNAVSTDSLRLEQTDSKVFIQSKEGTAHP